MSEVERYARLKQALGEILEVEGATREELLARVDPELRAEIDSLLAAHQDALSLEAGLSAARDELTVSGLVGTRLGDYRVLGLLGEGGMGTVFLAERADAAYQARVAIKVVRGMWDVSLRRRFAAERQALARLDHPHVARLLDGGETEDGWPFLVMELIEGTPIDRWCEQQQLSQRARLELFLSVADAVAFAHRRMIVHRDIKPNNILVDATGSPKLLDFGIAKFLDEPNSEHLTRPFERALTPDFASPEQLDGGEITAATDVWGLGRLLASLLGSELDSALGPPSARLRAHLQGDVGVILLTALAPDPARRYASVEGLAGDVRRYLENRPILARPASRTYLLGRFVRRNAIAVTAGFVVLVVTATGVATTWWQARRAAAERGVAEAVAAFVGDLLGAADSRVAEGSVVGPRGPEVTVASVLLAASQRLDDWQGDPRVAIELRRRIGASWGGLGDVAAADRELQKGLALAEVSLPAEDRRLAQIRVDVASTRFSQGRYGEIEELLDVALPVLEARGPVLDHARALNLAALAAANRGDPGAEALFLQVLALGSTPEVLPVRAVATANLGQLAFVRGDLPLAFSHLEAALGLLPADPPSVERVAVQALLVRVAVSAGDAAAARARLDQAIEELHAGRLDGSSAAIAVELATSAVAAMRGETAEVAAAARRALATMDESGIGASYPWRLDAQLTLATADLELGNLAAARDQLERILAVPPNEAGSWVLVDSARSLYGLCRARQGDLAVGLEQTQAAAHALEARYGEAHPRTVAARERLSEVEALIQRTASG